MINRGTRDVHVTPMHSWWQCRLNRLYVASSSFCFSIQLVRDPIIGIPYLCSISFTTSFVFLLPWYYIPVTESHVATFMDVISPSRPYVSLPVMWVNKSWSCSHMSSTVPSEYPTYTFMATVLPDDGWCSLSSLGKQWVIWAHGLRRRSLGIAVATMNYMTWSCCNPSRNVQSHHSLMIWSRCQSA